METVDEEYSHVAHVFMSRGDARDMATYEAMQHNIRTKPIRIKDHANAWAVLRYDAQNHPDSVLLLSDEDALSVVRGRGAQ